MLVGNWVGGLWFALVAATILAASAAFAGQERIIVASPDGRPNTIERAVQSAGPGDIVELRGGRYELTGQLFLNAERMKLRGRKGEVAVLHLSMEDPKHNSVLWLNAKGACVEDLEIVGGHRHGLRFAAPNCAARRVRIHDTGADAVWVRKPGHGALIEGCEIFNAGKRDSNAEGIDNVCTHDVVVRGCYIHDIPRSNGLYMKGSARRCLIELNVVSDIGGNGIMLGQSTGRKWMESEYECIDSVARNNLVMRTRGAGLAAEGAKSCSFYHNTLVDVALEGQGGFAVMANHYGTPCEEIEFLNNVVVVESGRPMVFVHKNGLKGIRQLNCDYNLWFHPKGSYGFWSELTGGGYLKGLKPWRSATGQDVHSFTADPALDTKRRYRPKPGSPAIDGGLDLTKDVPFDFSGTKRPQGRAPDIGAWEFVVERKATEEPASGALAAAEPPGLAHARALASRGGYEAAAQALEREAASAPEAADELRALAAGFRASIELRAWIIEGSARGRSESTAVDLMGVRLRGKVVAADEEGLTVAALGSESGLRWDELSPSKLFSLARKYAREGDQVPAEKRAALEIFARACGLKWRP